MSRYFGKFFFLALLSLTLFNCTYYPYGFNANTSGAFQDWQSDYKPDTLWVSDIYLRAQIVQKPRKGASVGIVSSDFKNQILSSFDFCRDFEIVVMPDVKFIEIDAEAFCPKVYKKDSCDYIKNLTDFIQTNREHDPHKNYLIPSYFLKSTFHKLQDSGGGSGTLVYSGQQYHFRYLDFETPIFRNGELVYSDSNYFIDTLIVHESEVQEKLFQIDQVIFDSLMYYSFDDKVEPLKLK